MSNKKKQEIEVSKSGQYEPGVYEHTCPFCGKNRHNERIYDCGTLIGASGPETRLCAMGLVGTLRALLRECYPIVEEKSNELCCGSSIQRQYLHSPFCNVHRAQVLIPKMETAACGAPEKALDNLSDAAEGRPLRHKTFLPVIPDELREVKEAKDRSKELEALVRDLAELARIKASDYYSNGGVMRCGDVLWAETMYAQAKALGLAEE